ncbi:Transposable element Tc3 transposase [Oopsacas minuta]|uniref:Transposable element Tc3 transposase n=1 Tax=Oopsacas minuta TaxID=111878 RepID=A0AAV7KFH0_9METZ|nr:Transposable element Tc3 transposase [Oopsacas minuta]
MHALSRTLIRSLRQRNSFWEKELRTSHVIAMVRESVEQSPKRSIRKRSQTLPISRSTMMRVMTEDLGIFPYRIQTHQKLSEADKYRRKEMAKVLLDKIEESDTFLKNLWTTDEAHFHLDGQVNSKNNGYWGTSPPAEVAVRPLHHAKSEPVFPLRHLSVVRPTESAVTIAVGRQSRVFWQTGRFHYFWKF